jgi:hypothetical protein
MPEKRTRRELRKFPAALTKRLAREGYKIERRYVNLPTIADVFAALERDEPIWVHQCWLIVRKTRQRARQAREAPTEKGRDANRAPGGGVEEVLEGGRGPYFA